MHGAESARTRRRRCLFVAGLLLPLAAFVSLAAGLHSAGLREVDVAAMHAVRSLAGPGMDVAILWISHLGYSHGVVPFDVLFVGVLLWRRHWREGLYAAVVLGGGLWLNTVLKATFARPRPDLWEPLWRYSGFSFPSGHAMATATLTVVLVLLTWRTRWRAPVLALMVPFTMLVGMSRPYMGVHYPSDVLGGWAFGCAWAVACYLLAFQRRAPWQHGAIARGVLPPG